MAAAVVALLSFGLSSSYGVTLPPGFDDESVAEIRRLTAFAFTPDGRLLVTTKLGDLRVIEDDALEPTPALSLDVCRDNERGLLGVAVDPQFQTSRNIFLYYTYKKHGTCDTQTATTPVNRVSRFVLGDDNVVDPASETVLIDNIPSIQGIHNGGDLQFGPDGLLYISVGDGGCDFRGDSGCGGNNDAARDRGALSGKILRITRDGEIPVTNPYRGPGTARCNVSGSAVSPVMCQEIFSWGLRNPWRIAFDYDAPSARLFINDVGNIKREEVDVGAAGADYGWNVREGSCNRGSDTDCPPPPPGMTDPLYDYHHNTGCTAITAGAFVPDGIWPAEHDDSYLFADIVCGKIFEMRGHEQGTPVVTELMTDFGIGNLVSFTFGPRPGGGQALYYTDWEAEVDEVRRITYVGTANRSPVARITADPTYGDLPLVVSFDGTQSSDRDDDTLTYNWDFGDGTPDATGPLVTHPYTQDGKFTATLTVSDGNGGQGQATVVIHAGNNPPQPVIQLPAPTARFRVGDNIQLQGAASDPEDGTLSGAALEWEVIRHHATHTHPFLPPTPGAQTAITGPPPEDVSAAANSYLELRLKATDSEGLSNTVTQDLDPRTVQLHFASEPAGTQLELAGTSITAPQTVTSWENWLLRANAPDQASGLRFLKWSDGGAQSHDIQTPASPATYTATFTYPYARPRSASPLQVALVRAFEPCTAPNRVHGPPLAHGSCGPPQPATTKLTNGTPDVNGQQPAMIGSVKFQVLIGDPATPADEADVRVRAKLSDVRSSPGLGDYAGALRVNTDARLTDKESATVPSVTTAAIPLDFDMPCTSTPTQQAGSNCEVVTTMDAVTPGAVVEKRRALMQLGRIRVMDGTTAGADVLAIQGLFVP